MEAVVFFISAVVILVGAIGVIATRNPVHAALSLVATLFGVAMIFINLEAYFVAAVQVIVYAGAIVVLFLFVIMLLGVDRAENVYVDPIVGQRVFALLAAAALLSLAVVVGLATGGKPTGEQIASAALPPTEGGLHIDSAIDEGGVTIEPTENAKQIGWALFSTRYVFAFEITGVLLTVAVVGAVTMARRPKGELQDIPDVEDPWIIRRRPIPADPAAEVTDGEPDDGPEADLETEQEEKV